MTQGYYAGISGIQANQYGMDVISDNLANISTTAYKSSIAEFSDLFSKVLSSSQSTPTYNDIGYGTQLQATSFQFTQGSFTPSDRYSDLALEGNGWFGVVGQNNQSYFTRDGSFSFDSYQKVNGDVNSSTSRLVTADGMYVMGTVFSNFAYDAAYDYGDTQSNGVSGAYVINQTLSEAPLAGADKQTSLEFPARLAYPAEPTTQTSFIGNLGLADITRTMSGDVVSANNNTNQLKLTFTQSATQPTSGISWDIVATVASKDGSVVYDTQNGQAVFDSNGALINYTVPAVNNDGTSISINLGSNFNGVISNEGTAVSGSSSSNGLAAGAVTKYGIDSNGIIIADFSNGRQSAIGRVAVYHFQNDQGLNRDGGTYYSESADSGKPIFWTDANGNTVTGAVVRSGMLEDSNARYDVGLTDMIVAQRAYQANSKTISTVDEMIQKALSMHR